MRRVCLWWLVLGLLMPVVSQAQTPPPPIPAVGLTCKLSWAEAASPDLKSFRLYKAPATKGYVKGTFVKELPAGPITVTTTYAATCADFGLTQGGGPWYLAVTAVDVLDNETDFSAEVALRVDTTAPPLPTGLKIISVTLALP